MSQPHPNDGWTSPASRRLVRAVLAFVAADGALDLVRNDLAVEAGAKPAPHPLWLLEFLRTHRPVLLVLFLLSAFGLWRFARRGDLLAGALACLGIGVCYETHTAIYGSIQAEILTGGACLFGWLVGARVMRSARRVRDVVAEDIGGFYGALGVFSAVYVAAGLSKILRTGFEWADGGMVRYILMAFLPAEDSPHARLIQFLLAHGGITTFLGVFTLVFELGAVAALFGPRWRALVCFCVFGFHVSLRVLLGMSSLAVLVLPLAFALPWPRLARRWQEPEPTLTVTHAGLRASGLRFAAIVLLLTALAWLTPVRFWLAIRPDQILRPWDALGSVAAPSSTARAPESAAWGPPSTDETALLGPIHPGATLGGWRVDQIGVPGDSRNLSVAISKGAATARLELVPTAADMPRAFRTVGDRNLYITHATATDDPAAAANALADALAPAKR